MKIISMPLVNQIITYLLIQQKVCIPHNVSQHVPCTCTMYLLHHTHGDEEPALGDHSRVPLPVGEVEHEPHLTQRVLARSQCLK